MSTTYPKVEAFARSMRLPIVINACVRELYGYAEPALDRTACVSALCAEGIYTNDPAHEVGLAIFEARFEAYVERT